jgi:hypothetical protein
MNGIAKVVPKTPLTTARLVMDRTIVPPVAYAFVARAPWEDYRTDRGSR